jgi:hypothetical protein
VSHLRRWLATDDIPADASRHGGPGREDIEWRLDADGMILVRERERAALFDGSPAPTGPARPATPTAGSTPATSAGPTATTTSFSSSVAPSRSR